MCSTEALRLAIGASAPFARKKKKSIIKYNEVYRFLYVLIYVVYTFLLLFDRGTGLATGASTPVARKKKKTYSHITVKQLYVMTI